MSHLPAGRQTPRTLAVCGLAAAGELGLVLSMADVSQFQAFDVLPLVFLVGPPAFLALLAWRRRAHPDRERLLAGLALGIASFGVAALGVAAFRFHGAPPDGRHPGVAPLAVPLVQWVAVLAVWVVLIRRESREIRASSLPSP